MLQEMIEKVYASFAGGCRVVTDSREVKEGDIFIALKGEHHDGNLFAGMAIERGARHVVTEAAGDSGDRWVTVPDPLLFLQRLARHHRRQLGLPVLGITGTNGKTTTKELCRAVLSRKFETAATRGNLNNHIGVPLTLLEMTASTRFGIVEMGANHPGEIATLCAIAEPDYGLITNIGQAHMEGFGSRENIIRAKNELYDFIREHGGTLFVNGADELLARLSRGCNAVIYGGEEGLARGKARELYPYLTCDLCLPGGCFHARTRLVGGYNLDNVLAAVAVGLHLGVDPRDAVEAIEAYAPANARSQLLQGKRNTIILDAYNANPSSMNAAITHFAGMPGENKLLVLGEMLELGDHAAAAHDELLARVDALGLHRVILVGRSFESLQNKYTFARRFRDTGELADFLRRHPVHSSLVLVKGSRGNKLEQIIEYL
jgi:UDP-N-acetylmuramoyl-tripeptide--D-alanyl-D-alanine ligase